MNLPIATTFTLPGMMKIRSLYVQPQHYLDPSASPLFGDYTGLPPLLIQAAAAGTRIVAFIREQTGWHAAS